MSDKALVLVVDDDANNRDVLEQELDLLGHRARAVADGREALAALEHGAFDAVLLDVMMPGLDGIEVLRRIRADPRQRDLPVIMISALGDLDHVVRCIELGKSPFHLRSRPSHVCAATSTSTCAGCLPRRLAKIT